LHSQITEKKLIACGDLVQALKECHASTFNKLTGACNKVERELGVCLGQERMARAAKNRENAKVRRERYDAALKAMDED